MKRLNTGIPMLTLFLCLASGMSNAQTANLLQNPNADLEAKHWRAFGQATVEEVQGKRLFAVRSGGYFTQDVILPEGAAGRHAVLIGRGSSERVDPGGAITGLPSLYGYMMAPGVRDGERILDYLQGQQMLGSVKFVGEWVKMWGVFKVPEGASRIRFFLNQALRQGVAHDDSATRFDDLGLYLFPTEKEARTFVDSYN